MKYTLLVAAMATSIMAAPTPQNFEWNPTLAGYFNVVFQYIQQAGQPGRPSPTCDLSRAAMPIAPTPLPTPPSSLVLDHVAIGRGVQVCLSSQTPTSPH
jgi:hypothetical protein